MSEDVRQADEQAAYDLLHSSFHFCKCHGCYRRAREALTAHRLAAAKAMQSDETVERVARALYYAEWAEGHQPSVSWESYAAEFPPDAEPYYVSARAAIRALNQEETP